MDTWSGDHFNWNCHNLQFEKGLRDGLGMGQARPRSPEKAAAVSQVHWHHQRL